MSTGESDYAKRVVELSMQLANSRADVENLRMRIKAVDKEHEQLKKDRADMVDSFDAALRRAKGEGAREMIKIVKAHKADQRVADDLNITVSFDSFNEVLDAITREIDARAAQIEADYE